MNDNDLTLRCSMSGFQNMGSLTSLLVIRLPPIVKLYSVVLNDRKNTNSGELEETGNPVFSACYNKPYCNSLEMTYKNH